MLSKPVTLHISSRKAVLLSFFVVFTLLVGFFILVQVFVVPKAQANPDCTVNDDLVVQNGKTLTVGGITRDTWVPSHSSLFSVSRRCPAGGIGTSDIIMENKDNCACFLSKVELREVDDSNEFATCSILDDGTNWILGATIGGTCADQAAYCGARCICW